MKRIVYLGGSVLLVVLLFVLTIVGNQISENKKKTAAPVVDYGEPMTLPTTGTTDIWDYISGRQSTTSETTVLSTEIMTDAAGAAVTDANGNPLYLVVSGVPTEATTAPEESVTTDDSAGFALPTRITTVTSTTTTTTTAFVLVIQ